MAEELWCLQLISEKSDSEKIGMLIHNIYVKQIYIHMCMYIKEGERVNVAKCLKCVCSLYCNFSLTLNFST